MTSTSRRNAVFLEEMGVGPVWTRRDLPVAPVALPAQIMHAAMQNAAPPAAEAVSAWAEHGIEPQPLSRNIMKAGQNPDADEIAKMDWGQLKAAVAGCTKCDLCRNRKKTVFGVGDEKAKWLFIGEGPGRSEDLQGEPFVGPSGKLLDNMLAAMALRRGENAYIANIVKCRPTDADGHDRAPSPDEVAACMPYLDRQIALMRPDILVALGKSPALALLKLEPATPVGKLRGNVYRYAERPLIVTYHPAYLLRSPTEKRKSWADLCLAMNTYAGISG